MSSVWNLGYSIGRRLWRTPVFTAAVVLTIALGVGTTAAVFGIARTVVFDPLPYRNPDQLVSIYTRYLPETGYDFPYFSISGPELSDVQQQVPSLEAAAYGWNDWNVSLPSGAQERLRGLRATADLFQILGVPPVLGRAFVRGDDSPGAPCVAVISNGLWRSQFGADPEAIGTDLRLDSRACTVVGVMPADFFFPTRDAELWTALTIDPGTPQWHRQSHPYSAVGRARRPMVEVQNELDRLRASWTTAFPDHYARGHFAVVRPLHDDLVGHLRTSVMVLLIAVGLVFMAVCANLSGVLLSRAEGRRREIAIRVAIGANRWQLIRESIAEHLVLAAAGSMAGAAIATWLLPVLLNAYPGKLPRAGALQGDAQTLIFLLTATLLAAVAVGFLPALQMARAPIGQAIRGGGRGQTAERSTRRFRSAMVFLEVAVSVVLLLGAGLVLRSYVNLQGTDGGFEASPHVLTFDLFAPEATYPDAVRVRRFHETVRQGLLSIPTVVSAGAISDLPFESAGAADDFEMVGEAPPGPGEPGRNARFIMVTPGALETLRVPLQRGRLFNATDAAEAPLVALVNDAAVSVYWPTKDPIGRTVRYGGSAAREITIVGVVGSVRSLGLSLPAPPAIYVPLAQTPRPAYQGRAMTFLVRSDADASTIVPEARAVVTAADGAMPLADLSTLDRVAERAAGEPKFVAFIMTAFAGIGALVGGLGLFAVLSHAVATRRTEIGVRMALGANRTMVAWLVMRQGLLLTAAGVVAGLLAGSVLTRLIGTLLYGVEPHDLWSFAAAAALVVMTALVACTIPCLRATRVDPIASLRADN